MMTADLLSGTETEDGSMRIEIDIDSVRRIARMRVFGAWDVSDFSAKITELTDNPNFIPGMPAIWDMRDADLGGMTKGDMLALGEQSRQLAHRRGNARVALVVPDDLGFGVARMLEVRGAAPHLDIAVFRAFGEAEEWIVASPQSDVGGDAI